MARRIPAAIDGSDQARKALEFAIDSARDEPKGLLRGSVSLKVSAEAPCTCVVAR